MKSRIGTLLASALLSACAAGPTYLGQAVSQVPFIVDGGRTVSLPVTRAGALPAENDEYKIESAGFFGSLKKGNPREAELVWTFSFQSKKPIGLDSVIVEKVTTSGGLELAVKDDSPTLSNKNWVGRSIPTSITRESTPWLYSGSDSTFLYKFTIRRRDGSEVVMYQPSIYAGGYKANVLRTIKALMAK